MLNFLVKHAVGTRIASDEIRPCKANPILNRVTERMLGGCGKKEQKNDGHDSFHL